MYAVLPQNQKYLTDREDIMTWHTVVISPADLAEVLNDIQQVHGTLTSYTRDTDGIHLTWTTQSGT